MGFNDEIPGDEDVKEEVIDEDQEVSDEDKFYNIAFDVAYDVVTEYAKKKDKVNRELTDRLVKNIDKLTHECAVLKKQRIDDNLYTGLSLLVLLFICYYS